MTTGIARESTAWRGWAAEQLGVSANATPAEVRAAFLALLPEVEFVPPPEWRAALRLLTGAAAGLPPEVEQEARAEAERRFGGRVEDFASNYWSLAVPLRQQRWQGLMRECGWSVRLRARLEMLRPGLTIGPLPEGESPQVVELAGYLEAHFVLPPAERTAARLELRQRLRDSMPAWENAAARLWKRCPDRAGLQGSIISELVSWTRMRIYLEKRSRQPRSSLNDPEPAPKEEKHNSWVVAVACLVLGMIIRAVGCGSDQRPSDPSPPSPTRRAPATSDVIPGIGQDRQEEHQKPSNDVEERRTELQRQLRNLERQEHSDPGIDALIRAIRKQMKELEREEKLDRNAPLPDWLRKLREEGVIPGGDGTPSRQKDGSP